MGNPVRTLINIDNIHNNDKKHVRKHFSSPKPKILLTSMREGHFITKLICERYACLITECDIASFPYECCLMDFIIIIVLLYQKECIVK